MCVGGYGLSYMWRACGAVLRARGQCYGYRELMDGGGGEGGRGEGRGLRMCMYTLL